MAAIKHLSSALARLFDPRRRRSKFIEINNDKLSQNEITRRFYAAYNARRGLPPGRMPHEILSRDDIARLVDAPFDEALVQLGFVRASHKTWVRRDLAPICYLFSLTRYGSTGHGIAPSFGFSLDFVPHVAAGKICWHRTVKTARFDLLVETESRWFGTNFLGPEQKVAADVRFMLPRALKMATGFWDSVRSLEDADRVLADYDRYAGRRFKLSYSGRKNLKLIRPSPAAAFVKAKLGNLAEARVLLDQWLDVEERISRYGLDAGVRDRLHRLLDETSETA